MNNDLNTGRTHEELSARGRKAGIASGEKRREKKRMREWAEIIGDKQITITNADGTKESVPYDAAVINALYQKAIQEKDARAAEIIMRLKGEMEDKVDITTGGKAFTGFSSVLPSMPNIKEICAKIDAQREQNIDDE